VCREKKDLNLNEQNVAKPMRTSKNGKGEVKGYQSGKKEGKRYL
jgi:hypothetical protein